jgi:hypothetical protein
VDATHLSCGVNETITVVLVFERNAERSVERDGLVEVLGEYDDRRRFSHEDLSCRTLISADEPGRPSHVSGCARSARAV